MRTSFVVVDNNVFGCINSVFYPNLIQVLASSVIRGATVSWIDGTVPIPVKGMRPATRADFDTFRVSQKGYDSDPVHFDYPQA